MLSLTACGRSSPAAQPPQAAGPVQAPVQAPAPAAPYALSLKGQRGADPFTRYVLRVQGGQGPGSLLVQFQLPEGASILRAYAENGMVQQAKDAAVVLTVQADTTVTFDIEGVMEGDLKVRLVEAESLEGTLAQPIEAAAQATVVAGHLPELQVPPISEQVPLYSGLVAREKATLGTLSEGNSRTVPAAIDPGWLKFEAGDVNRDGQVTLKDTTYLTGALLNLKTHPLDASQLFIVDLLDDGRVDYYDLAMLALKQVQAQSGVKVPIPSVHPKTMALGTVPGLLSTKKLIFR